jgi:outer membrane immunogenic protein
MRKLLAGLAFVASGVLATTAPLMAGDGYGEPRPLRWTGFYVGAHVGHGWGDWSVDLSHSSGAIHYNDPFVPAKHDLDGGDGWLGGLQAGYNYQTGGVVVGLEADVSWTGMDADGRFTTIAPNFTTWDINSSLDLFGTVRGRLGFVSGPLLIYGTAGLAWGITDTSQATNWFPPAPPDVGGRTSGDTNHIGFAVGGGVEWLIARNWSLKAEYMFIDLGKENYSLHGTVKPNSSVPYVETFAADLEFHTVRLGLNYRLGE